MKRVFLSLHKLDTLPHRDTNATDVQRRAEIREDFLEEVAWIPTEMLRCEV